MTWSLAFPNLLVGLREGLEAGLVVTILISAVRKLAPERSLAAVWLGVACAATLSLSFGAVLTFTQAELSPRAQEIFGGVASLTAVALVTVMIFWMRRTAQVMAGELRGRVGGALQVGGTALVATAFVAVAREGLEAALFVWTNAQAAGSSTSPLLGALIGLLIAVALCAGLYRRVLTLNLARFFTITGAVLVVIVAGVLAYGLRDLQDANVLPGVNSLAFDVSRQVPTGRWWTESIRGITNLDNQMTWLQVIAYLSYLAVVLPLFLRGRRPAPSRSTPAETPIDSAPATSHRRRLAVIAVCVALPALVAGIWVSVGRRPAAHNEANAVAITSTSCAADWQAPTRADVTYSITNSSTSAVDVEIVVSSTQAVLAEIEVLGPGTTRELPASFGTGSYNWKCVYAGHPQLASASKAITSGDSSPGAVALAVTTEADLTPALQQYRRYVAGQLRTLDEQVSALGSDLVAGNRPAAKRDWLAAHLTYHRVGAAYNAFGDAGSAVDGLAQGLPDGVSDKAFVGFHRIEYDLWSNAPMPVLTAEATALSAAAHNLHAQLPLFTFDPNDVTTRAHEILEDTLRFTLTGQDDYGSGSGFATAQADLAGDRYLVGLLAPLLQQRSPNLIGTATVQMDLLSNALITAGTKSVDATPAAKRQRVNAATSALLETLAPIPDLLEIRTK